MSHDLVIRNGVVVDGSGLDAHRADVAITGDRIAAVGRVRERGTEEIDAEGHVVTPGFIDCHTHMDAQLFWDPHGTFSCHHGVTTVVMGHCGFTLAPASEEQAPLVVRNLERAEDISGAAMAEGIRWSWTTFAEYLDVVDSLPKSINYAANLGHSALRTYVMGERAFEATATDDDLTAMAAELRAGMAAGAHGFTTSRTVQHQTSDGRPVASRLASLDEVRHLVDVVGESDHGVFQFVQDAPPPDEREANEQWLLDMAVDTRVPVALTAMGGRRGPEALARIDRINEAGGRAFGVTHPRGIGSLSSFRNQLPFDHLPEWQRLRDRPEDEQRQILRDETRRRELVDAARGATYGERFGGEARPPNFDLMRVLDRPVPPNPTVREVADERGIDPIEAMIVLALEHDFDLFFSQPLSPFDHDGTRAALHHPSTVVGFSDAGAHVSQMSDCSIQTHILAHWVRDRQDLTLEHAVQRMSYSVARCHGFADRGLVRTGMRADLNVFDPATVGPNLPSVVNDLPAGEPRLRQTATGFLATLVAGQVTMRDGEHTGALPGVLLRGGRTT